MHAPLWVTIPTFVCSLLSFLADSATAVSYLIAPPERHFRQALILNLLVADLINACNNTISGAVALSRRHKAYPIPPGPGCIANAYIGQFTVQAVDFNILVISLAVLLTVRQSRIVERPPRWKVAIVCLIPWIPPLITANIATVLGAWAPASGNWCWIKKDLVLRYTLTHGWRILIFFVTIGIYTYVYMYLKRVYGQLHISSSDPSTGTEHEINRSAVDLASEGIALSVREAEPSISGSTELKRPEYSSTTHLVPENKPPYKSESGCLCPTTATYKSPITSHFESAHLRDVGSETHLSLVEFPKTKRHKRSVSQSTQAPLSMRSDQQRRRVLRKMLLLNGYPILYVILWIPGIANRLAEIVLGQSPLWLTALQASTQLVGFANALTYAWNEQLSGRVKEKMAWRKRRRPVRDMG